MYNTLILDLIKIFNEGAYLSIVLDNELLKLNLNEHDRKVFTLILYGVVEKKLLLDYNLSSFTKGKRIKPYLKNALRIGAFCITYTNIANHYIVNELVKVVKNKDYKGSMLVNGILRNYERSSLPSLNKLNDIDRISLSLSLPLDLTNLLYKQYKEKILDFYQKPNIYNTYRINTLKTNTQDVCKQLDSLNIEYKIVYDSIVTKTSLIGSDLFKEGLIIAQDLSSSAVGHFLKPTIGSSILDACAAPGGKSLHIATLMNNNGEIICGDIYEQKLEKINENARKLGITIIKTILADASNYDYNCLYDVVLADVPCSGLGVIGHKPDLKYRLTIDDINKIISIQNKIINNVKKYVKVNGILLYSTCTINKYENEWMIKDFLKENENFSLLDEKIILPSDTSDGFYICKMKRIK